MGDWVLVIPVKRLEVAKTRLSSFAGPHRAALALAFAADTIDAAMACASVRGIAIVTDDPEAVRLANALGHLVVGDEPDAGLNPALVHGATVAVAHWRGSSIAALSSDLPALRPGDLGIALEAAEPHAAAFVADRAGTGTTLLTAKALATFGPRFGPSSAAEHEAGGAISLSSLDVPSLRRDVDTEADLADGQALGLGRHTTDLLGRIAP